MKNYDRDHPEEHKAWLRSQPPGTRPDAPKKWWENLWDSVFAVCAMLLVAALLISFVYEKVTARPQYIQVPISTPYAPPASCQVYACSPGATTPDTVPRPPPCPAYNIGGQPVPCVLTP